MNSGKYFIITKKNENHNGFQFVDGLNVLDENFKWKRYPQAGLFFCSVKNIFRYYPHGDYVREVTLPIADPDFKLVGYSKNHFCANKIILGEKHDLSDVSVFEYLISLGADFTIDNDAIIDWASENGCFDILKSLMKKGANFGNCGVQSASENGHLEIVKFLIENGANIGGNDDALQCASSNGHLEVVKFLVEKGADIRSDNDNSLQCASINGHLEVVKFLIENGADIGSNDNFAIKYACVNGYLEVVKFLTENGADIRSNDDFALQCASANGHLEVVKFLIEKGARNLTNSDSN